MCAVAIHEGWDAHPINSKMIEIFSRKYFKLAKEKNKSLVFIQTARTDVTDFTETHRTNIHTCSRFDTMSRVESGRHLVVETVVITVCKSSGSHIV